MDVNQDSANYNSIKVLASNLHGRSTQERNVEVAHSSVKQEIPENNHDSQCNLTNIKLEEIYIKEEEFSIDDVEVQTKISSNKEMFECGICGYKYFQKRSFLSHLKVHSEKQVACSICEYKTIHQWHLKRHMRKHTGEKPYACSVCEFRTAHKSSLRYHVNYHHTEESTYTCSVCDYRTPHKNFLECHLKTHTGESTYTCSICEFKTAQKKFLEIHMRMHTGRRGNTFSM